MCEGKKKKTNKGTTQGEQGVIRTFFIHLKCWPLLLFHFSHFQSISRLLKTELDNVVELDKYKGIKSSSIT